MVRWPRPLLRSAISRVPRCCAAWRPKPRGCSRRERTRRRPPTPRCRPAAGAFDLLRAALVDLEGAYDMYLRACRGSGRGRRDARRTALGGERHAAERRNSWSIDGVGQGCAALTKPGGAIPRYRPVPWPCLVRGRISPVLPGFRRLGGPGSGLVARGSDRPHRPPVRVRRRDLACARDGLRLRRCRGHRLCLDPDPQLDRQLPAAGLAARHAGRALGRRPAGGGGLSAPRRRAGHAGRPRAARPPAGRQYPRGRDRPQLAQPADPRAPCASCCWATG